jgi:hypothetical protein
VVGEGTGTPRVRDFGTPEDLGCSIIESPKGPEYRSSRVDLSHWEGQVLLAPTLWSKSTPEELKSGGSRTSEGQSGRVHRDL